MKRRCLEETVLLLVFFFVFFLVVYADEPVLGDQMLRKTKLLVGVFLFLPKNRNFFKIIKKNPKNKKVRQDSRLQRARKGWTNERD